MKDIKTAYILWLVGGWFGLHHFYLGRDRQAFVWWATLGGCLGLGWFRDFFRLPEYVLDANNDEKFLRKLRISSRPPYGSFRFAGEIVMGVIFGWLVRGIFPLRYSDEGVDFLLPTYMPPIATAAGVHLVANIGREKVSFIWALGGAFTGKILMTHHQLQDVTCSSIIAAICLNLATKEWRFERPANKPFGERACLLILSGCVYLSLLYCAAVTTRDGVTLLIRDAVPNILKSPAYNKPRDTIKQMYEFSKHHTMGETWEQIVIVLDPTREVFALKVLGINKHATQGQIIQRYNEISKGWHPDKPPKHKLKDVVQRRLETKQAYEILLKIKEQQRKERVWLRNRKRNTMLHDTHPRKEVSLNNIVNAFFMYVFFIAYHA